MNLEELFGRYQEGLPEGYLARVAQIESSNNPNAKNPNSSAGGLFQFIDSTARQYGLQNRYDPEQATAAAAKLARDNAAILRNSLGREPTGAELYLAHQQGAGGALKLLQNGDRPASELVGGAAAGLNGGRGMTGSQMATLWDRKYNGVKNPSANPNRTLAYAAVRGRNPADMPAVGARTTEGQMPQAQAQAAPMPDMSNSNDGGVRALIAQQAGGMGVAGPSVGGLGGMGGFRIPEGQPASMPSPVAAAPAPTPAAPLNASLRASSANVESLIPAAPRDPFAIIGAGARQNQEWDLERQGRVAIANEFVRMGMDPQRAVALSASPEAAKLAMAQIAAARTQAADSGAVGLLSGKSGQPQAPASPAAGAPSVMNDPAMQGTSATTRAQFSNVLRVLADPNVSKAVKDAAEKQFAGLVEDSKLTTEQKTHLQAKAEGFTGGILDMKERLARAGSTNVTVKNEGTIPPGYQVERDQQGNPVRMVPIPGGPVATEQAEKDAKAALQRTQANATGNVVLNALDDVDKLMATATLPTTGGLGAYVSTIGGTAAHDIANALTTIKANISFDRLGQMRAASPTGGALGAVSDTETKLLANSAAALEQSQSAEQFKANLARLRSQYNLIVHGNMNGAEGLKRPDGSSPPSPPSPPAPPSPPRSPQSREDAPQADRPRVMTKSQYDRLSPGAEYVDAEGNVRRKRGQ